MRYVTVAMPLTAEGMMVEMDGRALTGWSPSSEDSDAESEAGAKDMGSVPFSSVCGTASMLCSVTSGIAITSTSMRTGVASIDISAVSGTLCTPKSTTSGSACTAHSTISGYAETAASAVSTVASTLLSALGGGTYRSGGAGAYAPTAGCAGGAGGARRRAATPARSPPRSRTVLLVENLSVSRCGARWLRSTAVCSGFFTHECPTCRRSSEREHTVRVAYTSSLSSSAAFTTTPSVCSRRQSRVSGTRLSSVSGGGGPVSGKRANGHRRRISMLGQMRATCATSLSRKMTDSGRSISSRH
ncbi:hypothetical protein FKP32DRAFT_1030706 [Trametes sanguinea]|nr:hypothetical protein FKP32DRAFT_1030706 [Trametes sanguinea]